MFHDQLLCTIRFFSRSAVGWLVNGCKGFLNECGNMVDSLLHNYIAYCPFFGTADVQFD